MQIVAAWLRFFFKTPVGEQTVQQEVLPNFICRCTKLIHKYNGGARIDDKIDHKNDKFYLKFLLSIQEFIVQ